MLHENDVAPDFALPLDRGEEVTLSSFRAKKMVVYFYPKDDTPGCTKEACSFHDDYDLFLERGAVVIGISPDAPSSHERFRAKYGLPFYLLSDTDHAVAERYGAWGEKTSYGKKTVGILRSTFVFSEFSVASVFPDSFYYISGNPRPICEISVPSHHRLRRPLAAQVRKRSSASARLGRPISCNS